LAATKRPVTVARIRSKREKESCARFVLRLGGFWWVYVAHYAQETVLAVHEALVALETADPRLAQVAQIRYYGGYSEQEIAKTLEVTERMVQRDWEKARLILATALP